MRRASWPVCALPDLAAPGRMRDRVEAVRLLAERTGATRIVEGWVEGPCAMSADLRGLNTLMLDFFDDPPFVEALFDFTVRMEMEFARAQVEAGATLIGVGDAAASLVGPKLYTQFVLPYEQRLIAAIRALGVPVRLHICGNTKRIVEGMGQTGADIIDLDFPTPLGHARRAMRETQVLLGNIDPVRELRDGTPESVEAALAECHRAGGRGLHLRRRLRGAARHAARQPGSHGAIRAQPPVKLELHPRARQTLADQLFEAGVEFPCGGESACGGCKVRVLEGEVPVTATMRRRAQRARTPRRLAPGLLRVRGGARGGRSGAVVAAACSPTKRACPSSRARGAAR